MHTSKMINLVLLLRLLRLLHSRLQSKARARKTGFARRETSRMIRFWEKGRANEAPAYTHTHTRQVSKYVRSYAPGEDLHEGIACVARGFLYVRTEHSAHTYTFPDESRPRVCALLPGKRTPLCLMTPGLWRLSSYRRAAWIRRPWQAWRRMTALCQSLLLPTSFYPRAALSGAARACSREISVMR